MNKAAWTEVLVASFLSIPIGILTGLAVAPLRNWYRARGKSWAVTQFNLDRLEYLNTLRYRENPAEFTHFLLFTIVRYIELLMLWSFSTLVGVVFLSDALIVRSTKSSFYFRTLFEVGAGLSILASTAAVVAFVFYIMVLHGTWKRVKHFDSYVKHLPKEIRALELPAESL